MRSIRKLLKMVSNQHPPCSLHRKNIYEMRLMNVAATSNSFDEFQSKLLEQFQISVIEHRGRYSYLHPDQQEADYFNVHWEHDMEKSTWNRPSYAEATGHYLVRSHLRLVVNLQTNVKAMQSPAYAHRVKLSNFYLQQMANTIIYVQEHGFDTQSDLKNTLLASKQELKKMQTQFAQHRFHIKKDLNDQIRYTGQYYANKEVYSQFSNAKYKGNYRKEHAKEIQKYEEARNWLDFFIRMER